MLSGAIKSRTIEQGEVPNKILSDPASPPPKSEPDVSAKSGKVLA